MKTALVYMTIAITYLLISCEKSDELNGVTFTKVIGDTYQNYKLDGNIVNYDDIIGYPGSDYYTGHDPRNDYRIISRLKNDKKLIEIEK
jgi:hypothetical protein